MKKGIINIFIGVLCIVGVVFIYLYYQSSDELPQLTKEEVESVVMNKIDTGEEINLDIAQFVEYYNQISDVEENEEGAGTMITVEIKVNLKSGEKISVGHSGDQFEVSLEDEQGKVEQYWGKQQNINNLLMTGKY